MTEQRAIYNHNTPEPQPTNGQQKVTELVIEDLKQRSETGRQKYGTYLQTHNGRNALADLYQELLDAVQYAKQHLLEADSLHSQRQHCIKSWIIDALAREIHSNAVDKGFYDEPRSIGEAIALIHSEASEALEAARHDNPPDDKIPEFDGVTVELADCIIRCLDTAAYYSLPIGNAIIAKMAYNEGRERKHSKAF